MAASDEPRKGSFQHNSKTGTMISGDESHSSQDVLSAGSRVCVSISQALRLPNSSIRSRTSRNRCREDPSLPSIRARRSLASWSQLLDASVALSQDDRREALGSRARYRTYNVAQKSAPRFFPVNRSRFVRLWKEDDAFAIPGWLLVVARWGDARCSFQSSTSCRMAFSKNKSTGFSSFGENSHPTEAASASVATLHSSTKRPSKPDRVSRSFLWYRVGQPSPPRTLRNHSMAPEDSAMLSFVSESRSSQSETRDRNLTTNAARRRLASVSGGDRAFVLQLLFQESPSMANRRACSGTANKSSEALKFSCWSKAPKRSSKSWL
mmetsp:Transcript_20071/g.47058  ORF Transcript_20071/g.47058 Transcript_20071/m.47058 type:complete len:323 (+) Transcript_20071:4882-5850(+)